MHSSDDYKIIESTTVVEAKISTCTCICDHYTCQRSFTKPYLAQFVDEAVIRSLIKHSTQTLSHPFQIRVSLAEKQEVIEIVALHHVILKCKAELDDLKTGLDVLGMRKMIEQFPHILKSFFFYSVRGEIHYCRYYMYVR